MKKRSGLAIVVVALLVGLSNASAERSSDLRLPPPSFRAAPGWLTVTTGPMKPTPFAPQVWAITERSNLGALAPFALFNSLRYLSPGGILVWATTSGRGGPTPVFTRGRLPLRLQSFRVDHGWEGQPKPTCNSDYAGYRSAAGNSISGSTSENNGQATHSSLQLNRN
jgi:hypothetical protein